MTPAERAAKMIAAIGLFRHTESTKASMGFARELSIRPMPLPQTDQEQDECVALADSPRALSESMIELMFGPRRLWRAAPTDLVDSAPASLSGMEVTELGPSASA